MKRYLLCICLIGSNAGAMEEEPISGEVPTLDSFLATKKKSELIAYIEDLDRQLKARDAQVQMVLLDEKHRQHLIEVLQVRLAESEQEKIKVKKTAQRLRRQLVQVQRQREKTPLWLRHSMN